MNYQRLLTGICLAFLLTMPMAADDKVGAVQRALKAQGFFFGEPDGRVNDETHAALKRFQIRTGLKVTSEMDSATLQALAIGAPAATPATRPALTVPTESVRERARDQEKDDREFLSRMDAAAADAAVEATPPSPAAARVLEYVQRPRPEQVAPPETAPRVEERETSGRTPAEVRRYIERYLQAAEAPSPEKEMSFFADRVEYFDSGRVSRQFIRTDQISYYRRWPQRDFKLLGDPHVEWMEGPRAAVRFRIQYSLSSERERASGATENLVHLRMNGDEWEIVGIRERKLKR